MKMRATYWGVLLLATLGLTGCNQFSAPAKATPSEATREKVPPNPTPPPKVDVPKINVGALPQTIEYHVWLPLTQPVQASWRGQRYPMYTYVLYNGPANRGKLGYDERQALARLKSLLDTVGRNEDLASTPENLASSPQNTNLFLIPATAPAATVANLDNYSLPVARAYLSTFNQALARNQSLHKRLRKYGPFLLSTLKPIGEIVQVQADGSARIDSNQPILLVDMSSAHEKSVAEIVRTFKNHVADKPMTDTHAFDPLRLRLISVLLKLNEAIPLVSNAVAGSCGMVGAEAVCK